MEAGTLVWWSADRGFGFIRGDAGGADMFLHVSELEAAGIDPASIKRGQRLFYVASTFKGKPKASDVRLAAPSTTFSRPAGGPAGRPQ
jgi:CspA family cold shock protein